MSKVRPFKVQTVFVATHGVAEYRATIAEWVKPEDHVVEIGCEWGTTTELIAPACREVIGTDVSPECIERARQQRPSLRFEVLDGFDVRKATELRSRFDKVYIDISGLSGYRSLLDLVALLTMYGTVLQPEAIIVKSGSLKHFASHCLAWRGPKA